MTLIRSDLMHYEKAPPNIRNAFEDGRLQGRDDVATEHRLRCQERADEAQRKMWSRIIEGVDYRTLSVSKAWLMMIQTEFKALNSWFSASTEERGG